MEYSSVLFVLLVAGVCCAVQQDMCSYNGLCTCVRDSKSWIPIAVNCACSEMLPNLILSNIQMDAVSQIKSFAVVNCSEVIFDPNSFRKLHHLEILSVKHSNTVILNPGVFSSLNDLIVEDVGDLVLKEMSFMGVRGMSSISIKRTVIKMVPLHALFDIKGLRKLELVTVTLGNIKNGSVNIDMDTVESTFSLTNSTVENIEGGAFILKAKEVIFNSTTVRSIQTNGLRITADKINIEKCLFGEEFTEDGVNITSRIIKISGNLFNFFPIGTITNIHLMTRELTDGTTEVSAQVTENTFLRLDSSHVYSLLYFVDELLPFETKGNRITCDCDVKELVTFADLHQKTRDLVKDNYCIMECKSPVPLSRLNETPCINSALSNLTLFCETVETTPIPSSHSTVTTLNPSYHSTATASRRDDRAMQFTTPTSTRAPYSDRQHLNATESSAGYCSASIIFSLTFVFVVTII